MTAMLIGIIIGIYLGYKLNNGIKKLNKGIELKLFCYNLNIKKIIKSDVINIKDKKVKKETMTKKVTKQNTEQKQKMKLDKCYMCGNEDMYISGTKHLIACPECKRNSKKFKSNV